MQIVESFQAMEVPFTYFPYLDQFEYWKIIEILKKRVYRLPGAGPLEQSAPLKQCQPTLEWNWPEATRKRPRARCLRPSIALSPPSNADRGCCCPRYAPPPMSAGFCLPLSASSLHREAKVVSSSFHSTRAFARSFALLCSKHR
jgi:hypothetical protein